jgi:hypothetical protein
MTSHPKPHHHPAPVHKEKMTMKIEEFQPGDEVLVNEGGSEIEGVVRSIQLVKNLVDVQLYKQGHLKHGLTVAFPPEQVKARGGHEKAASA